MWQDELARRGISLVDNVMKDEALDVFERFVTADCWCITLIVNRTTEIVELDLRPTFD